MLQRYYIVPLFGIPIGLLIRDYSSRRKPRQNTISEALVKQIGLLFPRVVYIPPTRNLMIRAMMITINQINDGYSNPKISVRKIETIDPPNACLTGKPKYHRIIKANP